MELLLATNNQHKKHELSQILSGHKIITPDEIGIDFDCDETGTTFLANSLLKAETLFKLAGRPIIADDSGLCVDSLGGEPGIYSARYGSSGGPDLSSEDRNLYLLDKMKHLETTAERTAHFVCCMSLIIDEYRVYTVQESVDGSITFEPAGCGGFGYDPVFFLPRYGMTVAEIGEAEKNKISHRGRAASRLAKLIIGE